MLTTSDENLASAFGELGYSESFALTDTKLALGYLTVLIAGLIFLGDKKYEFNEIYYITAFLVVLYSIISLILMYFTSHKKYKNVKFVGYNDDNNKIVVVTWTEKYDPIYNVEIRIDDDKQIKKFKLEFAKFFDAFGYYKRDEFIKLIKEQISS